MCACFINAIKGPLEYIIKSYIHKCIYFSRQKFPDGKLFMKPDLLILLVFGFWEP